MSRFASLIWEESGYLLHARRDAGRIVLSTLLAASLAPLFAAERYVFETIGADQGLADLTVTALCQDRKGYLWAGTPNGLFRYDGHRLLAFSTRDGLPDASSRPFTRALMARSGWAPVTASLGCPESVS